MDRGTRQRYERRRLSRHRLGHARRQRGNLREPRIGLLAISVARLVAASVRGAAVAARAKPAALIAIRRARAPCMTRFPSRRKLAWVIAIAFALLIPAIWNRYPLLYSDSGEYLLSAMTKRPPRVRTVG